MQIGDLSRQLAEAQASHAAATEDKAESLKELTEVDAKAAAQLAAFSKGELHHHLLRLSLLLWHAHQQP
jgi:hypothetical protein